MMTLERFNQHWLVLKQCEQGGAKPQVYRELLEEITSLRAAIFERELRKEQPCEKPFGYNPATGRVDKGVDYPLIPEPPEDSL